ncbi:MAG: glycosyltransferase family 4 protein [bacterium]
MNILFLSRDYPPDGCGGVATYCHEMSRFLAGLGQNVFVIAQARDNVPSESVEPGGVRVFRVAAKKDVFNSLAVDRLLYGCAASRKLAEVVEKYGIDVIEGREAHQEALWYFFRHRRGRKPYLVVRLHTPESLIVRMNRCPSGPDLRLLRDMEEWWIRRADRVVGVTRAVTELTSDFFDLNLKDIPIIPNPVDLDFFTPDTDCAENGSGILYAGRFEFRKGVHVLIDAMPGVLKEMPESEFRLAGGDAGMKSALISRGREHGCGKNVVFLDEMPRGELRREYRRAAVCIVPSLWENHPYSCLEAMACGRPVVASAAGGLPEIIEDNVSGILVEPGNHAQLTQAIIRLLRDGELRKRLGAGARKRMEDYHAPACLAGLNLKLYESLAGGTS